MGESELEAAVQLKSSKQDTVVCFFALTPVSQRHFLYETTDRRDHPRSLSKRFVERF